MRAGHRHTFALGLRLARAWVHEGVARLRERTGGASPHALAAGGARAVGAALEVAAGPVGAVAIAAAIDVTVLAIATRAVRRSARTHRPGAPLRPVLDLVIADLARDRLCPDHLAAGWRAACGTTATSTATRPLALGLARAALRELGSHAATRTLRRAGLKKLLWLGPVLSLATLPREVRRAVALVERAQQVALG